MAVNLVEHFQTVGHLKCKTEQCITSFEAKREVWFEQTPLNPPPLPPAYRPGTLLYKIQMEDNDLFLTSPQFPPEP